MSIEAYKKALLQLLPQGLAWNKDEGSKLNALITGEAVEFSRLEDFGLQTLREINPLTTNQLINEWVEIALGDGLCQGIGTTPSELKAAILAKLISLGGSSKTYFQEVARAAGFYVSITDGFAPFRTGSSRSGDRLLATGFAYTWNVRTSTQTLRYFRTGAGRMGDPLVFFGNKLLECILRGIKPAHTQIIFSYLDIIINLSANLEIGITATATLSLNQALSASIAPTFTAELLDPWNPEYLDKLLLWYDANDFTSAAPVSEWVDKKGNRNAIQGDVGRQPEVLLSAINGRPVVSFVTDTDLEVLHLEDFDLNRALHFFTVGDFASGGGLLFDRNQLQITTSTTNKTIKALTSSYRPNQQGQNAPATFANTGLGIIYFSGAYYARSSTHFARLESDGSWTTLHTGNANSRLIAHSTNLYWVGGNSIFRWNGTTVTEYVNTVNATGELHDLVFNTSDSLIYVHDPFNQKLLTFNPSTNAWVQRATSTSAIYGRALASDGTNIYIRQATQIYKWNGSTLTSEGLTGFTGIECIEWANSTLWVWADQKLTNQANSYTLISVPTRLSMVGRAMFVNAGFLYIYDNFNGWLIRYPLSGTSLAGSFDNWDQGSNTMIVGTAADANIAALPDDTGVMIFAGTGLKRIERIRYIADSGTVPDVSIFYFGISNNQINVSVNGTVVQSATFLAETYRNPKILLETIAITNTGLVTFLDEVITINIGDLPYNAKIEIGMEPNAVTNWTGFFDDWVFTTEIS